MNKPTIKETIEMLKKHLDFEISVDYPLVNVEEYLLHLQNLETLAKGLDREKILNDINRLLSVSDNNDIEQYEMIRGFNALKFSIENERQYDLVVENEK